MQVRGLMWRHYSQNQEFQKVMTKVESKIKAGNLRMRPHNELQDLGLKQKAVQVRG